MDPDRAEQSVASDAFVDRERHEQWLAVAR